MLLEITYSPILVLASVATAILASFTALRLTSRLRFLSHRQRKVRVSQAALALGGGIWSMHFVGMLAVSVPVTIAYDPLPTLGSALIAVLVTGSALLSLHFGVRNKVRIAIAGTITGLGIVAMHYLGMSAISSNCLIAYSPIGVLLAIAISIAASIAAMELAYGTRSLRSIIFGSVLLGLAISAMHYSAMLFTTFSLNADINVSPSALLSADTLALIVSVASFVICGLFLLMAVPVDLKSQNEEFTDSLVTGSDAVTGVSNKVSGAIHVSDASFDTRKPNTKSVNFSKALSSAHPHASNNTNPNEARIPYNQNKSVRYMSSSAMFAAQADGHYCRVHNGTEELFCPWSISELEENLNTDMFIRTHRSYIINRHKVSGLVREGDKAFLTLDDQDILKVPVSRGRLSEIKSQLKL